MPRFAIQLHRARTTHFDVRLEKDGVFKSWAVPKGVPESVGSRHLAIQVEDHPLEFGDFEGTISKGEYGAGTLELWDQGKYILHEWASEKIVVTFAGKRTQGTYNIVRFRHKGEREWLIFKRRSIEEDSLAE